MGLISDYLEYRRAKKYYKRLLVWEHQMMEAGLPSIPPDFIPEQKGNEMTPDDAADLLRSTTPAPWDIVEKRAGQIDSIGPIEADSGLVVDRWDAELAAAAPELARKFVELGEENFRLKDAVSLMLEKINEHEGVLTAFGGESMVYQLEDFGIQKGDMD